MPVKFSCPIKDFNTDKYFDSKEMRKYDLFMQYGLAAGDAINDSGLEDTTVDKESVGVAIDLDWRFAKYRKYSFNLYKVRSEKNIAILCPCKYY